MEEKSQSAKEKSVLWQVHVSIWVVRPALSQKLRHSRQISALVYERHAGESQSRSRLKQKLACVKNAPKFVQRNYLVTNAGVTVKLRRHCGDKFTEKIDFLITQKNIYVGAVVASTIAILGARLAVYITWTRNFIIVKYTTENLWPLYTYTVAGCIHSTI